MFKNKKLRNFPSTSVSFNLLLNNLEVLEDFCILRREFWINAPIKKNRILAEMLQFYDELISFGEFAFHPCSSSFLLFFPNDLQGFFSYFCRCKGHTRNWHELPSFTVVIAFHNEARSTLLRTVTR